MIVKQLSPIEARDLLAGDAMLVDIREPDEHARENIPGAINLPLDRLGELASDGRPIVFHCRSGMRTSANTAKLAAATVEGECFLLQGGIDAWRSAGLPTRLDQSRPIEVMRQVQLIAGGLVLLGILLSFLVAPAFALLSAFVGAGLILAGATGWCGMATMLRHMPWNRHAPAA